MKFEQGRKLLSGMPRQNGEEILGGAKLVGLGLIIVPQEGGKTLIASGVAHLVQEQDAPQIHVSLIVPLGGELIYG